MFGSNILDIAIGLVFLFLLLSLICSAANEILEGFLRRRAADLERGIAELLGDTETRAFVARIYNHGLVNGLYRGTYSSVWSRRLPAYIPSRNFALALLSVTNEQQDTKNIPANVTSALNAFKITGANDARELQKSVEDWYNSAMDRVSGWYKRRTQIIIFLMGFAMAVLVNADCLNYANRLSKDDSLRQSVVAMAQATARNDQAGDDATNSIGKIKDEIQSLDAIGLPVGWDQSEKSAENWKRVALKKHGFGWLLTALAISLGAPFWFDMLNKLVVVRSTVKPHEKSHEEGSKDATPTKSGPASTA